MLMENASATTDFALPQTGIARPLDSKWIPKYLSRRRYMLRNKKGFTLIELLIVVVIIGILAAIAIPKFANTKDKAYVAAMKSDLRNLATFEEQYAADNNGAYFSGNGSGQGFNPSKDVTVKTTAVVGP